MWTDEPSYSGQQAIAISTSVRVTGAAVPGAKVSVAVTLPAVGQSNKVTTLTTTTNANDVGVVTLRLKKSGPKGIYRIQSTASLDSSLISRATTSFLVP